MPVHINLTVADVDRSLAFYQRWLGFTGAARAFPDGTVFTRDPEGTDLAFHAGLASPPPDGLFRFGFRRARPDDVRALQSRCEQEGLDIVERDDSEAMVSLKFRDPDGYVVEVYWEPEDALEPEDRQASDDG